MRQEKYNAIKQILYCSCAYLALIGHSIVAAQETSPSIAIEEITVTAQMREENVQSVPIAIGVYKEEFIANIGAKSLTDMEYAIPNINFGNGSRDTRGEIAIRGVGAYSRNIGTDARVVVYVDGVLTGRSSTFDQSLVDVDHIEVLRGPQGTLSGANAIVGAINIITQAPSETLSATLMTDVGNFGLRSVSGKLNLPLTSDLYASLSLGKTTQDGFIQNVRLNRDLQGVDRDTAKLKFRYLGIEKLTLDIGFDYLNDDTQSTNGEALTDIGNFKGYSLAPNPREVAHNADEFSQRQLKGTTLRAHYLTEKNYEWVFISGVRHANFSELNEEDYSPLDVATSIFDEKSNQFSQEIRFISPRGENTDYVIGAYLLDQDISTQRGANLGANFPNRSNTSISTPASSELRSHSAYANGNWRFTDKWEATAGLRYIHESKMMDYSSIDTTKLFINVNHLTQEKTYNELLPKVGLSYHATPNVLIYSSISRGYRSGGWNADFLSTLENFQFNPEYAINYELGVKSSVFNNHLTFNTSAFSTKFRDFQVFQFITNSAGGTIISYTNAGKVTSQGIEVDIEAKLNTDLSLSFNSAFTQAKFDEFKNGGGLGINYDNNFLPFAPEHTHYLGVDYQNALTTQASFYAHIDYGYTGNYFSNPDNSSANAITYHKIANARFGLKLDETVDLSLWVKNLTDDTDLRQRSVSFLGVPRGYYNPPLCYGLSVKYNFD